MWDYTEKVKEHFFHPRNVGEVENPDGVGEVGSLACGDALKLTFKLDENKRIVDVKFKTFGCGSAIASSSALTEIIKGMTLDEAAKVTNKEIADYLGGLPEQKMHCSVMGREALEAAIENYRGGGKVKHELSGRVVCTCFGVTEDEIVRVIRENDLTAVDQVTNYCKAGGGCGGCKGEIEKLIQQVQGDKVKAAPAPVRKGDQTHQHTKDTACPADHRRADPSGVASRRRRYRTYRHRGQYGCCGVSRDVCTVQDGRVHNERCRAGKDSVNLSAKIFLLRNKRTLRAEHSSS